MGIEMPFLVRNPEQPLEQPIRLPPVGAHVTIVSYNLWTNPGTIVIHYHNGDIRTNRTVLEVQIVQVSTLEGPGENDTSRTPNERALGR